MNSYQINLEAARQQGFRDGTDPESARRGITDAARLKMFGTTYMQGYKLGRREATSRRQGPCNIGSGAGDDCPPTVGETDEYYQFSMIDGLALRLQNDIVHAMTVMCREDARAKAVERAARLYGFDRVFDVNLHPRARAHIDDFVREKTDEYEREFKRNHKWNTHKCEAVDIDIRLLQGRVQDRKSANYVKRKIKEAKRAAEGSLKRTKDKIVTEARTALDKIEAYAKNWLEKTRGRNLWQHEGHKRATAWEKASNRAENLSVLRSEMFPLLDDNDTSEMEAWAEALYAGRAYAEIMDVYPRALRGFSAGGIKIWMWWMAEQMREYEVQRDRVRADFLEQQEADRYREEMLERRQQRMEEIQKAREEKTRQDLGRRELDARQRREEAEAKRLTDARGALERREAAEKKAEELAERARMEQLEAEAAILEAEALEDAEEALRDQQEFERKQATLVAETARRQREANARRLEEARQAADRERLAKEQADMLDTGDLDDNMLSDSDGADIDEDDIDEAIDEDNLRDAEARAEEARERQRETAAAEGDMEERTPAEIEEAEKEAELQKPENVAKRREEWYTRDARNRLVNLQRYANTFERAGANDNARSLATLQKATETLFEQESVATQYDNFEMPNGVTPAERLFYAVSLDDIFFDRNSDKAFKKRKKAIKTILDEDRLIKAGWSPGVDVAIEDDVLFNAMYVRKIKAQAELLNMPILNKKLKEWQSLLGTRQPRTAEERSDRKKKSSVSSVVASFDDQFEDSESVDDGQRAPVWDQFMESDRVDVTRWLAQSERQVGDRISIISVNQLGDSVLYEVIRNDSGELELQMISDDETGSETETEVEQDEIGAGSATSSTTTGVVVGIPVAQPVALVRGVPIHAHQRMRQAFTRVVMRNAASFITQIAPRTAKRILPQPASILKAIPEVLASIEPVLEKVPHVQVQDYQDMTQEVPTVIENMVR